MAAHDSWIMMKHERDRASVVAGSIFSGNLDSALSMFTAEVLDANKPPTMVSLWRYSSAHPREPDLVQLFHRHGVNGSALIEAERDISVWLAGK